MKLLGLIVAVAFAVLVWTVIGVVAYLFGGFTIAVALAFWFGAVVAAGFGRP